MYWRALNAEEGLAHMPVSCVRPLASQQQRKKKSARSGRIACASHVMAVSHSLWGLASKWLISCQGKIPVAHSAWVVCMCMSVMFLCILFLSYVYQNSKSAYVYTDSSVSLHPTVKQFVSLETHTHVEICTLTGWTPNSAVEPLWKYVTNQTAELASCVCVVERVYCVFHLV